MTLHRHGHERELQVACLWGLLDAAVRELREEIITLSPGTQVAYSLGEDVLVIKGSFDDDTESALVACIKAYVEKHMHHNLLDEQSRIRQIVRIDVGAALGSREGLKYVKPSPLIKETDVRDDGPSTPVATVAPIQVSWTWIPSHVRLDYFRKDPHCILDRVAAATGTNISLEHPDSKDIAIRVSSDVPEKVDDAMERLGKLDHLLALVNTPHRAFASYVPDTKGLRFGILKLAQLNEIAPRRVLVDPKSQIKYSIPGFLVPVSCRIDPATNSFSISEHLRNPGGVDPPELLGNRQTIRCWSGFTYPGVGKPGENRGTQYSGLVVLYQPTLPGAERSTGGKSQAHTCASVKQEQVVDTKVTPAGPSKRPLETTLPGKTARLSCRPAPRSVSTSSASIKLPGVKKRRPVLPGGRVLSTKAGPPTGSTTPADSGKSTQSEFQCSDAQKKVHSEIFEPPKRRPELEAAEDLLDEILNSTEGVEKPQTSPEKPLSTGSSSVSSSKFNVVPQAAMSSSQPISRTGTISGAHHEQRKLIGFSDKETVIAGDEKTTPAGSHLEDASISENSSTSPVLPSAKSTKDNAPSEYAGSQNSEFSRWLPESTQSPVPAGDAASNDNQETPQPMKSLPLAPSSLVSLPADGQSAPHSTMSPAVPPPKRSITPHHGDRGTPRSMESPLSMVTGNSITAQSTSAATTQNNLGPSYTVTPYSVPQEAWLQGRGVIFGVPTQGPRPLGHDMYVPIVSSPYPGCPIILQPLYCPTQFPGFSAAPMHPTAPAVSGPSQWSPGQASPISQQQLLPDETFQQRQTPGQQPATLFLEHGGSSGSIEASAAGTTAASSDSPRPRSHSIVPQSHRDALDRPIQERLADSHDGDKKDFHSVMNQRTPNPSGNTNESSNSESKTKGKKRWSFVDIHYTIKSNDTPISASSLPPKVRPHNSPAHAGFVKEVYRALAPILTTTQVFPGPLELEVQIGLVTMMNKLGAAEQSYMSFEEMKEVICPRGELNRPSTIFLGRLTALPADIDHILNVRPDNKARLFDSEPSTFTIDYDFHCVLKNGLPLVVSIDEKGDPTVKKPEAVLGSVHISYPDRIWDAAVVLHGHLSPHGELDPEVERAVQYIAKNLWVEPGRSDIRLLTRVDNNILSVKKVILKRISNHRCTNDRYVSDIGGGIAMHSLQLRVTEVQDLILTARQSNCDILEAVCGSLDDMVTAHRQWWEIALISPSVQTALSQGVPTTIGDNHRNWCPIDILGNQTELIACVPASLTAQSIGHYGLGSLLGLATAVVENIDPVGYSNAGPAGDRNKE